VYKWIGGAALQIYSLQCTKPKEKTCLFFLLVFFFGCVVFGFGGFVVFGFGGFVVFGFGVLLSTYDAQRAAQPVR
jgi:hypothetical protein